MCNLELEIGRRFRGRVLRVHPFLKSNNTVPVFGRKKSSMPKELRLAVSLTAPRETPNTRDHVTANPDRVSLLR